MSNVRQERKKRSSNVQFLSKNKKKFLHNKNEMKFRESFYVKILEISKSLKFIAKYNALDSKHKSCFHQFYDFNDLDFPALIP